VRAEGNQLFPTTELILEAPPAVFTAIANLLANHFWTMTGEAHFNATNGFFEHIAMIAGFILAAMIAEHEQRGFPVTDSR
jgi:uncharacterized membrane protein YphA (DoxX/SURF4 family)